MAAAKKAGPMVRHTRYLREQVSHPHISKPLDDKKRILERDLHDEIAKVENVLPHQNTADVADDFENKAARHRDTEASRLVAYGQAHLSNQEEAKYGGQGNVAGKGRAVLHVGKLHAVQHERAIADITVVGLLHERLLDGWEGYGAPIRWAVYHCFEESISSRIVVVVSNETTWR